MAIFATDQLALKYGVNERTIRRGIEGMFSDIKTKVRVHSGISRDCSRLVTRIIRDRIGS